MQNNELIFVKKYRGLFREEFEFFFVRYQIIRILLKLFPPYTGNRIRSALFRLAGFSVGPRTIFWGTPNIVGESIYSRLIIGESCKIGVECFFDLSAKIVLDDFVTLGPQIMIITGSHKIGSSSNRLGENIRADVEIGKGVWIGTRCTILPGVKIGDGAVIAAGALVNKDVPSNSLAGGVPAKIIRPL